MNSDFNEIQNAEQHLYDGLEEAPCMGENLLIPGPAGALEAILNCPVDKNQFHAIAVVCHPHPLYGGSMANKVVHIISNTFNELGLVTLRFNFRGVGLSKGRFDQGRGETEDLLAVVAWLRDRYPGVPLWLAGFSFGSYVALRAQAELHIDRLLLVAPAVTLFDFTELPTPSVPWVVIQGGRDEVISPEKVSMWVGQQKNSPDYVWFSNADHFFHGRLNKVREAIMLKWGRVKMGANV